MVYIQGQVYSFVVTSHLAIMLKSFDYSFFIHLLFSKLFWPEVSVLCSSYSGEYQNHNLFYIGDCCIEVFNFR